MAEAPSLRAASHPVSRDDFRERLEAEVIATADPVTGLFGPGSVMWTVNRHTLVYVLGITQAAFLDVAHPAIANGIADHSTLFTDPRARGHQTYAMITTIVFGGRDAVVRTSRALFARHERVRGSARAESGAFSEPGEYQANEGTVLLWVHATMWWVRLNLHEAIVGPLTQAERERYVAETSRFAHCFAIPEELLPADYRAWDSYVRNGPPDVLARSADSRRIMAFLAKQIPWPARAHLLAFNSVMLPETARTVLGLPDLDAATLRRHRRTLRLLRLLHRTLPGPLRELPPYRIAMAAAGGRETDRTTRRLANVLAGEPPTPRRKHP